jgi:hypothetical protein
MAYKVFYLLETGIADIQFLEVNGGFRPTRAIQQNTTSYIAACIFDRRS